MSQIQSDSTDRRAFLGASSSVAGLLLLKPETVFGTQANSTVEVGIIGAGGRGQWLGDFFIEHAGARLVALADVFQDRLDKAGRSSRFPGAPVPTRFNAYRELIASRVDAVVVETPPYFTPSSGCRGRRRQTRLPGETRGVDAPGCAPVAESGEKAAAG
jgi:hypothetical protein